MKPLRQATVEYVKKFDKDAWFKDPVRTLLKGESLVSGGKQNDTVDAWQIVNGKQIVATPQEVDQVIAHLKNYVPAQKEFIQQVRAIEDEILSTQNAAVLVGNQLIDFGKQDGITEIEEALQANLVERRLNDLLYADERAGKLEISRAPAFVGTVSNFTNFLDLCRKTLRNLELGVPAVIFSRSNTTQHMFRWVQLLNTLLEKHGLDSGMVTYVSCDVEAQRKIISAFPDSPLYFTGSRPIAEAIKEICPKLMASTGGPNTMVALNFTEPIKNAAKLSAFIENSGQCTALRHLVIPPTEKSEILKVFQDNSAVVPSALASLEKSGFANIIDASPFTVREGYEQLPGLKVAYKIGDKLPEDIEENWREVYVDVTQTEDFKSENFIGGLSDWVSKHQPISLAVNGTTHKEAFAVAKDLFERTGIVVYTVGSLEAPALTAQARPQDAEVFGEFPPRGELQKYTKFPVVVPTSTPGYNTEYSKAYLTELGGQKVPTGFEYVEKLRDQVEDVNVKGYMNLIISYLQDAVGPKESYGGRTALWGLQRSPLGKHNEIRVGPNTSYDTVALHLLPFYITNAAEQVTVTCDPANSAVLEKMLKLDGVRVYSEAEEVFQNRTNIMDSTWNTIYPSAVEEFPLVGHFVSLLVPLGHVKSTKKDDKEFVQYFKNSPKWLKLRSTE
eukprot:TRINITY_DN16971_c0_g1_i1.p1 TRINITY_DN16971_c0_g1~~TRINITY_DN16971_c0_g1_i1.p1  ORF type:complete len:724 (-),score=199.66 TRINITY_DN16971_c0_g1_i1:38-2056(-)